MKPMIKLTLVLSINLILLAACGKSNSGSSTRTATETSRLAISSSVVSNQSFNLFNNSFSATNLGVQAISAPNLQMCIKAIILKDQENRAVKKPNSDAARALNDQSEDDEDEEDDESNTLSEAEEDQGEIEFHPGLIDLSTSTTVNWGSVELPVGFSVSRIVLKVKKASSLCGVNYALKFNSMTTTEEVELKWKFNQPLDLTNTKAQLQLGIDALVTALNGVVREGNSENMKSAIEGVEETQGETH